MERNIVVTEATGRFIEDLPVEIVERKGIGHPDSLCDGIAERVSVEYTRWCEENLGGAVPHKFDKGPLAGRGGGGGVGGARCPTTSTRCSSWPARWRWASGTGRSSSPSASRSPGAGRRRR